MLSVFSFRIVLSSSMLDNYMQFPELCPGIKSYLHMILHSSTLLIF
jgi:hypothetical protein